jgi:hypothetical protein
MNVITGGTQLLPKIQRLISDNPRIIRIQAVQTTYQIFSYTAVSISISTTPEQFQMAQNDLHIQRERRDIPHGTHILSTYCAILKGL